MDLRGGRDDCAPPPTLSQKKEKKNALTRGLNIYSFSIVKSEMKTKKKLLEITILITVPETWLVTSVPVSTICAKLQWWRWRCQRRLGQQTDLTSVRTLGTWTRCQDMESIWSGTWHRGQKVNHHLSWENNSNCEKVQLNLYSTE